MQFSPKYGEALGELFGARSAKRRRFFCVVGIGLLQLILFGSGLVHGFGSCNCAVVKSSELRQNFY